MRRLILLVVIALGLLPVTCMHNPGPPEQLDERQILTVVPLAFGQDNRSEVRVAGAWELNSPNHHFGSYSALLAMGDGTLLAAADTGRRLRFTPPGARGPAAQFDYFARLSTGEKRKFDVEALTRDADTGQIWAAYEHTNTIERYSPQLRSQGRVRPAAMRNWPGNSGPEAIVRLSDRAFVVLAEASRRWFSGQVPGVLFAGDPVERAENVRFSFRPPAGYRPVDMALLPDGRVLILVRKVVWGLPPGFTGKLVVADPRAIRRGKVWSGRVVADLAEPIPSDNYEGLAVEPAPGGGVVVWLISDSNNIRLQRTLLLKLLWDPKAPAAPVDSRR